MWNNVINAWWPLVFYPATDAPRFTKGMWAMIGTAIVTLFVTAGVYYMEQREKRVKKLKEIEFGVDGEGEADENGKEKAEIEADTREHEVDASREKEEYASSLQ